LSERHGGSTVASSDKNNDDASSDNDMCVSCSYVSSTLNNQTKSNNNFQTGKEKIRNKVLEVAEAFNISVPQQRENNDGDCDEFLKSAREHEPLCEFTEMEELLTGAFPEVFMLGKAYNRRSSLSNKQLEHLLLQFTNAAATNRGLLFYLYDVACRHTALKNVALKIWSDPQAFETYSNLVTSDTFKRKIVKKQQQIPSPLLPKKFCELSSLSCHLEATICLLLVCWETLCPLNREWQCKNVVVVLPATSLSALMM